MIDAPRNEMPTVPRAESHKVGGHVLYHPTVIRHIWIWSVVFLALLTLGDIWVHGHAYFGIDGTFVVRIRHLRGHGAGRQVRDGQGAFQEGYLL